MITYLNPAEWVHEPLMATWPAPVLWRFAFPLKINVFSLPFDRPFFLGDSHFHQETTFSEKFTFSHFSHVRYLFFCFFFIQPNVLRERTQQKNHPYHHSLPKFMAIPSFLHRVQMYADGIFGPRYPGRGLANSPLTVWSRFHFSPECEPGPEVKVFWVELFFPASRFTLKRNSMPFELLGSEKKSWKSLTRENTTEAKFS